MSLWFVTPAHRRYALSAVCFEQRRQVIEALRVAGVEAHCVVIANDKNLDLARAVGFETVEQRNDRGLGRKFNDGMEYAGTHGAEWIVPIGSDSFVDPAYFLPLPELGVTRTSPAYCVVTTTRMAVLEVADGRGAGPYMFPRAVLESTGFRPAVDRLKHGIDGSTVRGIREAGGPPVVWEPRTVHPYQYVGFRGIPHITPYAQLRRAWGVADAPPWPTLARHYPPDLVKRARVAVRQG